ncbi:sulfatase-like hydrolase/transferase [Nocardia colli]|uniref:Sulfatase-like hydrolase/transferase n=1 Tax=Nocardia colli TaxID=2545717 RepID=A0A5N0E758_9NOCA|nr:alkaline phosphatase family protein [Nocardia colli]KAA8884786.1 sulfatase-like hydrolase/transferase [Nocardia colli]
MRPHRKSKSSRWITATAIAPIAATLLVAGPATGAPGLPGTGSSGSNTKVVVIGLDGTMYKKIVEAKAPNLLALSEQGTLAQSSIAPHTTISGPSWATVLTGVWDTKHGIKNNNFDATPFAKYPTVFTQLETAKPELTTESIATWGPIATIAGSGDPHADVNIATAAQPDDPDESKIDAATADASAAAIAKDAPDFLFTHLDQVDEAGHSHGGASREYLDAVTRVDQQVGKIVAAVDARAAANPKEKWQIIVTADHGHRPTGGHGGQSADETANFVIARGSSFKPGAKTKNSLVDITPTAVALLGVPASKDFDGTSMINAD